MALSSYAGLRASIADWLKNSSLTAVIPDFITLAEARFNREIRHPKMEATGTLTAATDTVALPGDFLEMRCLWREDSPDAPLDYFPPENLRRIRASGTAGTPTAYTIVGDNIILAPAPSASQTLGIEYYQKIPALASGGETNWLLTSHPDLYLSASLAAAEIYGWNDERVPLFNAAVVNGIESLNAAGDKARRGSAPLQVRSARAFS